MQSSLRARATDAMKPEFAFYYPGQYWRDVDWIKNLVCFFDGVAMLVPEYMPDVRSFEDLPLATSLKEHDLLHVIRPERVVDSPVAERLAAAIFEIIDSGALEPFLADKDDRTSFGSISKSRLGFYGNEAIATAVLERLKERGLARDSTDGVSVPMHGAVRAMILILLAQILRSEGGGMDITLSPATDQPKLVEALTDLMTSGPKLQQPTNADVVTFDMATVSVDMSKVPIDEILDYRQQNYAEHRDYILKVRRFARELSAVDADERAAMFEQREDELNALAQRLRNNSRKAWKKHASFGICLAGFFWTAYTADPVPAILGTLSSILGYDPTTQEREVYSYLLSAPNSRF